MLTSAELRWFKRGALPQEIAQWFQQAGVAPPEEREDVYLYVPENDYMGLKLRQGRLEIKWRKAQLGILRFGDAVEGKAEKWGKWLCEDPSQESFQLQDITGTWVRVKKKRFQRRYQVFGALIKAVGVNESIDQGCNVELTQLRINNNDWWSIAFEAFGKDERLMDSLKSVASEVFQADHGLELLAKDSYAYPSWLCAVAYS